MRPGRPAAAQRAPRPHPHANLDLNLLPNLDLNLVPNPYALLPPCRGRDHELASSTDQLASQGSFTDAWVRSIILQGVFVTIKREIAAIPPEAWAAWAAAEAGRSDQVAASDVGAHHRQQVAASEPLDAWMAALGVHHPQQVAASDAMDSLGAHHPPSTATGLTSAHTTTATAPTSGATFS